MKNIKTLLFAAMIMTAATTTFFGCKDEIGERGPQGETGVEGPAGSTILSGSGQPASTLGVVGDFYLDLATSNFYGPKKAAGWGVPFSMKGANGENGATGANGAAGSKILSGIIVPGAEIGVEGDYYLDKTTYSMYGPKTAAGWGVALSLRGTANVIYSGWNKAVTFRDTTIDNTLMRIADLKALSLTNEILERGAVQVYMRIGSINQPLPYSSMAGGKLNTIAFMPRLNRFIINRFTADNSNSVSLSGAIEYRYIVIPGGVSALGNVPQVDLKDYSAVQRLYNIGN